MITHYDLFAGIGGFSIALEEVFYDEPIRHIFCEWESFPTAVLRQHWPDGEFWGDIAELVAHTERTRLQREQHETETEGRYDQSDRSRCDQELQSFTIVTGGFPCQPFSHAGRRKGTADDRYQWPNMFQVIRNVKPEWVIAENVRGLVTWNEGMVLEQVCADLESEGYEVQPFIIPAVAVGAPHRRDRVWIVAHRYDQRATAGHREVQKTDGKIPERYDDAEPSDAANNIDADAGRERRQPREQEKIHTERTTSSRPQHAYPDWSRNWQEVAFETCHDGLDDGISRDMGGTTISSARWRKEGLKAYGNAIVPQVAMQIMKGIRKTYENETRS